MPLVQTARRKKSVVVVRVVERLEVSVTPEEMHMGCCRGSGREKTLLLLEQRNILRFLFDSGVLHAAIVALAIDFADYAAEFFHLKGS